jgi:hypothetical protein
MRIGLWISLCPSCSVIYPAKLMHSFEYRDGGDELHRERLCPECYMHPDDYIKKIEAGVVERKEFREALKKYLALGKASQCVSA